MILSTLVFSAALAAGSIIPREVGEPSENGFPNPDQEQLRSISEEAGGLLPNSPLPTSLKPNSATALQLIAFNELFEVAYFSSLLNNITSNETGYEADNKDYLVDVFTAVRAQEELHAIGALAVLKSANVFAPSACKYQFPVAGLRDAIALAETFTALVLGALQSANEIFAADGLPIVRLFSSIIGQEGEQNGYYRVFFDKVPSESPFLTTVPAAFAWSALQLFVVPDSCGYNLSEVDLPIFPPIATNGMPVALAKQEDQTLQFAADLSGSEAAGDYVGGDGSGLYMTYTTGQLMPISVEVSNVTWDGSKISYEAEFPYTENIMRGFSHGALTTSNNFTTADDVVEAALAGPAVIQTSL